MKRKRILWIIGISAALLWVILFVLFPAHGQIEQWSGALTAADVDTAEVASGYGVDKQGYTIPKEEYRTLIALLRTVTEANSSRKAPRELQRIDSRLALHANGKLWLFHCYEGGTLGLMFHDSQTGAYFGCEGKLLYIKSPALWDYIVNTIEENAS